MVIVCARCGSDNVTRELLLSDLTIVHQCPWCGLHADTVAVMELER